MEKKYEIWIEILKGQGIYIGDIYTNGEKCGKSCQFYREISHDTFLEEYSSCQLNGAKYTILKDANLDATYDGVFCWRSDFCRLVTEALDSADNK